MTGATRVRRTFLKDALRWRDSARVLVVGVAVIAVGCTKPTHEADKPPMAADGVPAPAEPSPAGDSTGEPKPSDDASPPPGGTGADATPSGPRVVMVSADHPFHARLEGDEQAGECSKDGDCHVGGCGGEICSARPDVNSTCEVLPLDWPPGRACGCVDTRCQWWHASETLPPPAAPKSVHDGVEQAGKAGVECGSRHCKPGEECISYHGIAGPSGPAFQECGIRCKPGQPNDGCPKGTRCITIADGPGSVCR